MVGVSAEKKIARKGKSSSQHLHNVSGYYLLDLYLLQKHEDFWELSEQLFLELQLEI